MARRDGQVFELWYIISEPMHIAYLHYLYGRDTALLHVEQFAAAARQLGHRVDVHAMNLAPPPSPGGSQQKPSLRLRARQTLKRRFGRWLHDPKELWWNWRYIRAEKKLLQGDVPDVLLVRSQGLGLSCVPVARHFGIPLVLEVNAPTEEVIRYLDHYVHLARIRQRVGAWKMRQANGVVVVSSTLKQYYIKRLALDPAKITVAPNGADLDIFRPEVKPDVKFPRDPERPRIGYVGSFQQWHDLDLLGTLVKRVAEARPSTRFLMVGAGPGVESLQRTAQQPEDRLAFTGRVDHHRVPGLVASLDIGLLAEAAEYQCPLKIIEWMAAGLAIVAPAYGPLRDLIDHETHGLLFEPGDLDAMVKTVVRLTDDAELRQRLGQAAAQRAHSSLGWTDNAQRVIEACERALHTES